MGLAIVLTFDRAAEQAIAAIRQKLIHAGLPPTLDAMEVLPHISLAVFADDDDTPLIPSLEAFAHATPPFPLILSALGAFPSAEGVLFLAPTPTEALLRHHRAFHSTLGAAAIGLNPYYRPDAWLPHCTLAAGLTPSQMALALEVCMRTFQPLEITCHQVALVRFHPVTWLQSSTLTGVS